MVFKSNKQRKCVMAMLQANGFSQTSAKFICVRNPGITSAKLKKMNFKQLSKKGIKLSKIGDVDKDGVINMKDCKPLDKKRQGIIHNFIKKKNAFIRKRDKNLEKRQDKLLKNLDKESVRVKKTIEVNKALLENKKLKQKLDNLRQANFVQTKTGKIITVGTAKAKKAAKKFLKKIFN